MIAMLSRLPRTCTDAHEFPCGKELRFYDTGQPLADVSPTNDFLVMA